ncbi:hypothetical protein EPUS_02077 [Endocarpon pusillum Z07020]|uniref:Nucleoside phosphorylase domain-containing protein n=1 Tax=Endocarpon pusillum (strain Z07020 / HMAS-L-300199) TaxID=1263415 RepID=U1HP92_ENDPU|nr:uncharacterized protein EPUS_02077 [Endocarpon pusillum Z07020]ERF72190.1 hypothetical protein EPUS_02077 [Endocarpon pusillum Z07020]
MDDTPRSIPREDYTVGWICALPTESIAAQAMLDERHEALPNLQHDDNTYTLGRIAKHNVAIACLPKNQIGTTSAATVATTMRISFPSIRFGLMVGIGGGVPSKKNDIRLGDIVISTPTGTKTGVVQYDFGKTEKAGEFRRTGALGKPPAELLGAVAHLETKYGLEQQLSEHISNGFRKWFPNWATRYAYQGAGCDRLFEAGDNHLESDDENCQQCSGYKVVDRLPRGDSLPIVHYGNIASGNQVMKHGLSRDRLSKQEDIICFEMEAAGLMDNFQCLVIRGICDYADSHKNKRWQPYAAATAAAYAREILLTVAPKVVQGMAPIWNNRHWLVPRPVNPFFTGQKTLLKMLRETICDNLHQEVHHKQRRFVIIGIGGAGKSEVCLKFAEANRDRFWAIFWVDASSEASLERNFIDIAIECGLQERSLNAGKRWLENTEHTWLLIVDNADDRKIDYSKYLPSGNRGNILMTTRNPECSIHCTVGQELLEKLDVDDAEKLLLKASGIDESQWDVRKPAAANIVQLLGRHALAITQAGAFVRKGLCTLEEYPHEFQHQRQRLLRFCPDQSRSTYGGVYTTFEVSAQVLEKSSDPQAIDALELLRILAFVHFDRVPILIFRKAWTYAQTIPSNEENGLQEDVTFLSHWHVSRLPGFMRSLNSGELDIISLREAVRTLASFSIISINETDDISMHPLVHAWAKDRLDQSDQTMACMSSEVSI